MKNKITHFLIGASLCGTAFSQTNLTGPSSSQPPYVLPMIPGATITSIFTTTDAVGGYTMCGTPDGLGAFDNGNGTFTLLMNHEFAGNGVGVNRSHGASGAFVSKWVINKSTLAVVSGADLVQNVKLWTGTTYTTYNGTSPSTLTAFNRFCSADLPPVAAYYNKATGKGTKERMFMNGEESGNEGRLFAHIATGPNAGTSYELPYLGKFSCENAVACPNTGDKTVVGGMDDTTPGQVYFYIGNKSATGTEIEKAGLTGGKLYGVAVQGLLLETNGSFPAANTTFSLVDLGQVEAVTGTSLNTISNNLGVTQFLRPEDGSWDPSSPNDFYFNTTNAFGANSRLWRLRFTNIQTPELGGTITAVLDGSEGQQMLDNMTIDYSGHILLVEDVGNNAHNGKVWQYDIATDALVQIGQHDPTRFISGGANFLTQDEEASGILDVQAILGPGMFLTSDQAHYTIAGQAVEGGQLLAIYNPSTASTNPEINVQGNTLSIAAGNTAIAVTDNTGFGAINVGVAQTNSFLIQNTGTGNLKINGISLIGANAADFALVNPPTFPLIIPANGSQVISVKLLPSVSGVRTATVVIMNNDFSEQYYDFSVQGTGAVAEINVVGNSVNIAYGSTVTSAGDNTNFGQTTVNTGNIKTFAIQNTGNGTLTITGITSNGTNGSEFVLLNLPAFPISLAGNTSQTFAVQFMPTASGQRNAFINVASSDADESVYSFRVEGTGAAVEINVTGNNINIPAGATIVSPGDNTSFGPVAINTSYVKTFVIQNTGSGTLNVSGIAIYGANASEFTLINTPAFPLNIAANSSQAFSVQFMPTAGGTRNAGIIVSNNDADEAAYSFHIDGQGLVDVTGINEHLADAKFVSLYPNPSRDEATLKLQLDNSSRVQIKVIDMLGKTVSVLADRNMDKGEQLLTIATSQLKNGEYIVQIISGTKTSQIKMIVTH